MATELHQSSTGNAMWLMMDASYSNGTLADVTRVSVQIIDNSRPEANVYIDVQKGDENVGATTVKEDDLRDLYAFLHYYFTEPKGFKD